MVHQLMSNTPPPFSDWKAQVERVAERLAGRQFRMHDNNATRAYYNAGVSVLETAQDFTL